MFLCEKIRDDFYVFSQRGVRCFLLIGPDRSLLIDSGFEGDLLGECARLTQTPICLILTHADLDHIGCMHQFAPRYLHPEDVPRLRAKTGMDIPTISMAEDDVFAAGAYRLRVLHMPGHTPGNVVLYDRNQKLLIAGDTLQDVPIYMFGEGRDLARYIHSLKRLKTLIPSDTVCYSSHGTLRLGWDCIDDLISAAEEVRCQRRPGTMPPQKFLPEYVMRYGTGKASFLLDRRMMEK